MPMLIHFVNVDILDLVNVESLVVLVSAISKFCDRSGYCSFGESVMDECWWILGQSILEIFVPLQLLIVG